MVTNLACFCCMPVETTFKAKGVETATISHQEAQGALPLRDDLSAYLDLSQKLLAIWGSPTDNKMGTNVISKLLVGCQRDFQVLFGCMNMSLPSEITRELLSDLSSSGVALHYLKDRFHTPEAAKISNLYLALTKVLVQFCIFIYFPLKLHISDQWRYSRPETV